MSLVISPSAPSVYKRFMTDLFDEKDYVAVPTGFQALFGMPQSETYFEPNELIVDTDIIRANEDLAQMVPRGTYSNKIDPHAQAMQERFTTRSMVFPFAEEETTVHASELKRRSAGETPYERMDSLTRLRLKAFRAHKEHSRKHIRLFEYLAAQSIQTGKMPAIVGTTDTNLLYDFKRNAAHNYDASAAWLTAGTDIKGDINAGVTLQRKNGHTRGDYIICGANAWKGITQNTALRADADNRDINTFFISMEKTVPQKFQFMIDSGFDWRGQLETLTGRLLQIFTYDEYYTNSSGVATPYIGDNVCVIGATSAKTDRFFGPNERLDYSPQEVAEMQYYLGISPMSQPLPENVMNPGLLDPRMFNFDAYITPRRDGIVLRTQTAPIFATTQTDAWCAINTAP